MTTVRGSWKVEAGNSAEFDIDTAGKTPEEVAYLLDERHPGVSVCHQCDDDVTDPELGDLTEFEMNGKTYTNRAGKWIEYTTHDWTLGFRQ